MEGISLKDVFNIQTSWDYFLYAIMLVQFILLVILFATENMRDTLFIATVVLCAFADKAYLFGYVEGGRKTLDAAVQYHAQKAFMTFAIRVVMFALPLILVTQTKVKAARPLSILLFLMSLIYMAGRWTFEQRVGSDAWQDNNPDNSLPSSILHASGFWLFIGLWQLKLRWEHHPQQVEVNF